MKGAGLWGAALAAILAIGAGVYLLLTRTQVGDAILTHFQAGRVERLALKPRQPGQANGQRNAFCIMYPDVGTYLRLVMPGWEQYGERDPRVVKLVTRYTALAAAAGCL